MNILTARRRVLCPVNVDDVNVNAEARVRGIFEIEIPRLDSVLLGILFYVEYVFLVIFLVRNTLTNRVSL